MVEIKRFRKLIRNKKGLSPLFVSLYMAILVILLLSTLFIALELSSAAIVERIRTEQVRAQERIALIGPGALNLTQDRFFIHSLRVNNTGDITVRIRALYIDHMFVCDPSELEGDSYIAPKESLWIKLFPVHLIEFSESVNSVWTVTTERGTKAAETGGNLTYGQGGVYTPNKFYIGPLMLVFDMFHWQSESGPWRNGWTIPKGTQDVSWRILLVNVDDRDISVTETTCLTLISNDNSPKDPLTWYIDPNRSPTVLKPGVFNFIYYSWNKPYSRPGSSRHGITGMTESTTCINFLTFFGSFIESNGTKSFGQTVPFEAVLVTTRESMAASVELTADPETIRNDGVTYSTITAVVRDENGDPVQDAWIDFYTSKGSLSESHVTTDVNGVATTTLRSTTAKTIAHVVAICQGVYGSCNVAFTPASKIDLTSNPSQIVKNGGISQITVQLLDGSDFPVQQEGITITVEISSWSGKSKDKPTLTYESQSGSLVTVTTDPNGQAVVTLTAKGGAGVTTVKGSGSGLAEDSTIIEIV